jgi:hypothetical protein
MISRQGQRGRKGEDGERGPRGEKGDPGVTPKFVSSEIDENYNLVILRSDNSLEIIPLRASVITLMSADVEIWHGLIPARWKFSLLRDSGTGATISSHHNQTYGSLPV